MELTLLREGALKALKNSDFNAAKKLLYDGLLVIKEHELNQYKLLTEFETMLLGKENADFFAYHAGDCERQIKVWKIVLEEK